MGRLFDDRARTDASPSTHSETRFAFLNRVRGSFWGEVRATLEAWFASLPSDAQPNIRGQVRRGRDDSFDSAFWELYLHESMLRCGHTVQCHPEVGGPRKPDFLVDTGDGRFYMEAKNIGSPDAVNAEGKRLQLVHDAINTLACPAHLVGIEVETVGSQNLSLKRFKAAAQDWLGQLPARAPVETDGLDWDRESFEWADADWSFRLFAMERPEPLLGSEMPPLAVLSPSKGGALIADEGPLRKALSDKGKAYGPLSEPFVIAVRVQTLGDDRFASTNALYGSSQVEVWNDADGQMQSRHVRARNGYWYAGDRWKHDSVSAVLVGHNLVTWNLARVSPTCWMHPDPACPLTPPPCWEVVTPRRDGQLDATGPRVPPHELFGVPKDWLSGDPFKD